jgi:hypothetical protein
MTVLAILESLKYFCPPYDWADLQVVIKSHPRSGKVLVNQVANYQKPTDGLQPAEENKFLFMPFFC